jgi:hypothetical protein
MRLAGARKTLFNSGFMGFADEGLCGIGFGATGIFVSRVLSFLAFIVHPHGQNHQKE